MEEYELRLEVAKAMLLMRFPFFGYIVSRLNISRDDKVGTFAIDERCNVFYNRKFLQKLSDENLLTVLAHEALHAVFLHFTHFSKSINHSIMNLAADIEINDILVNIEKMDFPMASVINLGGRKSDETAHLANVSQIAGFAPDANGDFIVLRDRNKRIIKCRNKSSVEIYYELSDMFKKSTTHQLRKESASTKSAKSDSADGNLLLPFPDEDENPSSENQSGKGIPLDNSIPNGFDEHKIGEIPDSDRADEESKWGEILIGANIYQESIVSEKIRSPNGHWYQRYIDKILKPKIDWRAVLRRHLIDIIPFNYSYGIPSKKSYAINVYEPKILQKPLGITVCIDISGSIGKEELQKFLSEIVGVAKATSTREISIRRLFWSTKVDEKNDEIFTSKNYKRIFTQSKIISSTGGTRISCVKEYLDKHRNKSTENLIIYLTDGIVESQPSMPKRSFIVISEAGKGDVFKAAKIPFVKMNKHK